MSFSEIRFPEDISYGSSGGPEYSTGVIVLHSGHEQRNINWAEARARYNAAHGVKTQAQLDALIAFFRARRGRAHGFRYKDWADYSAIGQIIGTGDGGQTVFQLTKTYVSGSGSETRVIRKPVSGTVKLYLNSVLQTSGISIDHSTGIATFSTAPGNGVLVSADFEFDVPVRFDTDRLTTRLDEFGSQSWLDIPLIEIRTD